MCCPSSPARYNHHLFRPQTTRSFTLPACFLIAWLHTCMDMMNTCDLISCSWILVAWTVACNYVPSIFPSSLHPPSNSAPHDEIVYPARLFFDMFLWYFLIAQLLTCMNMMFTFEASGVWCKVTANVHYNFQSSFMLPESCRGPIQSCFCDVFQWLSYLPVWIGCPDWSLGACDAQLRRTFTAISSLLSAVTNCTLAMYIPYAIANHSTQRELIFVSHGQLLSRRGSTIYWTQKSTTFQPLAPCLKWHQLGH